MITRSRNWEFTARCFVSEISRKYRAPRTYSTHRTTVSTVCLFRRSHKTRQHSLFPYGRSHTTPRNAIDLQGDKPNACRFIYEAVIERRLCATPLRDDELLPTTNLRRGRLHVAIAGLCSSEAVAASRSHRVHYDDDVEHTAMIAAQTGNCANISRVGYVSWNSSCVEKSCELNCGWSFRLSFPVISRDER
jgi:hypothetical protein